MRKKPINLPRVMLLLAVTVALVASAVMLRKWTTRSFTNSWARRLEQLPDDRVLAELRLTNKTSDEGIGVLAEALASRRETVKQAARKVLRERTDSWETLKIQPRTTRVVLLLDALAEQVDRYEPASRRFAAATAIRVLAWPINDGTSRAHLIAVGERLVRAGTTKQSDSPANPLFELPPENRVTAKPKRRQWVDPAVKIETLSSLPGGDLPIGEVTVSPRPADEQQVPQFVPAVKPPRTIDPFVAALPIPGTKAPRSKFIVPPRELPSGDGSTAPPSQLAPQPTHSAIRKLFAAEAAPQPPSSPSVDVRRLDTVDLMRRLHLRDHKRRAEAEDELISRGFDSIELEIARRLTSDDIDVRRRLVDALPRLQDVDGRAWLLRLAHDPSAEVRLAAMGTLAAGADRRLLARIEALAHSDRDPRIRRLAAQLSRDKIR